MQMCVTRSIFFQKNFPKLGQRFGGQRSNTSIGTARLIIPVGCMRIGTNRSASGALGAGLEEADSEEFRPDCSQWRDGKRHFL
jgi:hypothetical protein